MTKEEIAEIAKEVTTSIISNERSNIERVIPWLKAIVAGSFAMGVWVATMQAVINQMQAQIIAINSELAFRRDWMDETNKSTATLISEVGTVKSEQAEMRRDIKTILEKIND